MASGFTRWRAREDGSYCDPPPVDSGVFRILVATDNHLGFMEDDPVRGGDSFRAMDEILGTARARNVDMVLLGGDLFHMNQPSRSTLLQSMKMFRSHVLGDSDILFGCESAMDAALVHNPTGALNYEDPNMNIALPIFIIHGNHDDPVLGSSAIDVLSHAGLVNYIGKQASLDSLMVKPLLFRKGESRLALYGLGYYSDLRVVSLMQQGKCTFARPSEGSNDYFNIMLIHQNRYQRDARAAETNVNENSLPAFLDCVFWGHEHECKPDFQPTAQGVNVVQLGSSVITSLSDYESSAKKYYMILEVHKRSFRYEKVLLRSNRRFYFENMVLADVFHDKAPERVSENDIISKVKARIQTILKEDDRIRSSQTIPEGFEKPLIRIRLNYSGGFAMPRTQLIHADFLDVVANPTDIVNLIRVKTVTKRSLNGRRGMTGEELDDMVDEIEDAELQASKIEELVLQRLTDDHKELRILSEKKLTSAVHSFVEFSVTSAIPAFVDAEMEKATEKVLESRMRMLQDIAKKSISKKAASTRQLAMMSNARHTASSRRLGSEGGNAGDGDDEEFDRTTIMEPADQSVSFFRPEHEMVNVLDKDDVEDMFGSLDNQVLLHLKAEQEAGLDEYVETMIRQAGQNDPPPESDDAESSGGEDNAPTTKSRKSRSAPKGDGEDAVAGPSKRGRGPARGAAAGRTSVSTSARGRKKSVDPSQSEISFAKASTSTAGRGARHRLSDDDAVEHINHGNHGNQGNHDDEDDDDVDDDGADDIYTKAAPPPAKRGRGRGKAAR
eukprot:ANDGO_04575.mRNA.1 DNA repair protein rad32